MRRRAICILALAALAACTGSSSGTGGSTAGLTVCVRDVAADSGAPGACHAATALLQCSVAGGGGSDCLSDDGVNCTSMSAPAGSTCTNACSKTEYAASCGGPGPQPDGGDQLPPTACRTVVITPGGASFYCCPCG